MPGVQAQAKLATNKFVGTYRTTNQSQAARVTSIVPMGGSGFNGAECQCIT